MTRTALVIGCGGTLGGAWSVAALHALAEHLDWDPREADILQGTSAGAELATMLGAGFSVTELVDMQLGRPVTNGWPRTWPRHRGPFRRCRGSRRRECRH